MKLGRDVVGGFAEQRVLREGHGLVGGEKRRRVHTQGAEYPRRVWGSLVVAEAVGAIAIEGAHKPAEGLVARRGEAELLADDLGLRMYVGPIAFAEVHRAAVGILQAEGDGCLFHALAVLAAVEQVVVR